MKDKPKQSTDDTQTRENLYAAYRDESVAKQNSNSEQYDKSILTLSSGGLGLSLAFIKDVVPLEQIPSRTLLGVSWMLFVAAIVITVFSFQISQKAIRVGLLHAEQYYLNKNEDYVNKRNIWGEITEWLNIASGFFFVAAVLCTAYFVWSNLPSFQP